MLEDVFDDCSTPITVTRVEVATAFVKGRNQVTPTTLVFDIDRVTVQPMGPKERELLAENIRDKELIKIYTDEALLGVDVPAGKRADRVLYKGQDYVVQSVEDWEEIGGFFKSVAIKEND